MKSRLLKTFCDRSLVWVACFSLWMVSGALNAQEGAAETTPPPDDQTFLVGATTAERQMGYSWTGFPGNVRRQQDAVVLIEKEVPQEIRPDQSYTYEIRMTNQSSFTLDKVVLTEQLPEYYELVEAAPRADKRGRDLKWEFTNIAPFQRETIYITGKATQPGEIRHAGGSDIEINLGSMASVVSVIEPLLQFEIQAPQEVVISDSISTTMSFRNTGTAPVEDANLIHTLPEGLTTLDGQDKLEIQIGNLLPGETKTYNVQFRANDVGQYSTVFVANAYDGVTAEAELETTVLQPELVINADAPSMRFVGNVVPYTIEVRNVGNGIARSVVVEQTIPDTMNFERANEGGAPNGNRIVWRLGTMAPGDGKTIESRLVGNEIEDVISMITARATAAETKTADVFTEVAGIAAILLEVGDINDPVAVGESETYEITVDNQGSLAATNVVVKCVLEEDKMEFMSAGGATPGTLEGDTVVFEPLSELKPGDTARWRAIVRAKDEGDVRFKVLVESEQLSRPVVENEASNFYY